METITAKDVKRVWADRAAICVELKDGRVGKEFFRDYEPLRKASPAERGNFRLDFDGVWFDGIGEGLELSGFFAPKKDNPTGMVFWRHPEINAAAIARRLGIAQPLMAAYVSGAKRPSAKRRAAILAEIASVGRELAAEEGRIA